MIHYIDITRTIYCYSYRLNKLAVYGGRVEDAITILEKGISSDLKNGLDTKRYKIAWARKGDPLVKDIRSRINNF